MDQNYNGKSFYEVAAGIIHEDGRILITRRPRGTHLAGHWEFPGGKQEQGETIAECLQRELLEELGLEVLAGRCVAIVRHDYHGKIVRLHFLLCTRTKGHPQPIQGQEIAWVPIDGLKKLPFPPPDRQVLEILETLFEKGD